VQREAGLSAIGFGGNLQRAKGASPRQPMKTSTQESLSRLKFAMITLVISGIIYLPIDRIGYHDKAKIAAFSVIPFAVMINAYNTHLKSTWFISVILTFLFIHIAIISMINLDTSKMLAGIFWLPVVLDCMIMIVSAELLKARLTDR
jgi:hypothetical protein